MTVMITIIAVTILISSVQPLERREEHGDILSKIIQLLSNKAGQRRRAVDQDSLNKAKSLYKQLTRNMNRVQIKQLMREGRAPEDVGDIAPDPSDKLAEEELTISLSQHKSALYDRAHLEKEGKKDFLVLGSPVFDHFVTVVPNAMYQRIEKNCVNWLDDCSLKGIRARLLRPARAPYR